MNIYRKLIAALVLLLYAPTAVLAGVPLLVCQDEGGHQQIEWRTSGVGQAAISSHAAHDESDDGDENAHSHKGGCVDRDLISNSAFSNRSLTSASGLQLDTGNDQTAGDQINLPGGAIALRFFTSRRACLAAVRYELPLPSLQLLQLKTVVLRI